MQITYGIISQALQNTVEYYKNPLSTQRLIARETELSLRIKDILRSNTKAFYGDGHPYWGSCSFFQVTDKTAKPVEEIIRHTSKFKQRVDLMGKDRPHHCLNEFDEKALCSPFKPGISLRETAYQCQRCDPTIPEIFYVLPDADIYIIVKEFPQEEELARIEKAAEQMGFFPLYRNPQGIIKSLAANQTDFPMSIDLMFVKKADFIERLKSSIEWPEVRVPSWVIRYGTESYRDSWLHLGIDAALGLLPLVQYDAEVKTAFFDYLKKVYSAAKSEEIIQKVKIDKKFGFLNRFFLEEGVIVSFKHRYQLGIHGQIKDLIS